jgi:hypothetical protein
MPNEVYKNCTTHFSHDWHPNVPWGSRLWSRRWLVPVLASPSLVHPRLIMTHGKVKCAGRVIGGSIWIQSQTTALAVDCCFLQATVQVESAPIQLELHCCIDLDTLFFCFFLSPTLHLPWVLYRMRQRCNEVGYLSTWATLTSWNELASIRQTDQTISNHWNTKSLFARRIPDKEDCDYISLSSTGFLVMATLWKLRTENRSSPPNVRWLAFIHSNWQNMVSHPSGRSAHETILRRQLWNIYSQISSR